MVRMRIRDSVRVGRYDGYAFPHGVSRTACTPGIGTCRAGGLPAECAPILPYCIS